MTKSWFVEYEQKHTLPGCSAALEGKGLFRMRKTYLAGLFSSAGGQGFVQNEENIPCPAVQQRRRARVCSEEAKHTLPGCSAAQEGKEPALAPDWGETLS